MTGALVRYGTVSPDYAATDPTQRAERPQRAVLPETPTIRPGEIARLYWAPRVAAHVLEIQIHATCGSKRRSVPGLCLEIAGVEVPFAERTFRLGANVPLRVDVRNGGKKPWKIDVAIVTRTYADPVAGGYATDGTWIARTLTVESDLQRQSSGPFAYVLPVAARVLAWEIGSFGPRVAIGGIAYGQAGSRREIDLRTTGFDAPTGPLRILTPPLAAGTLLWAYTATPLPGGVGWLQLLVGGEPPTTASAPTFSTPFPLTPGAALARLG